MSPTSPGCWELNPNPGLYIAQTLSQKQQDRFGSLPVGEQLTWKEFLQRTGAPKASAKLLKDRLVDPRLLDHDVERKLYMRKM